MNNVLFLCTGNYYRSRFAEIVFNYQAGSLNLDWVSISRGLDLSKGKNNVGPISQHALQRIKEQHLPSGLTERYPIQVTLYDMRNASRIICLQESEHRPYMEQLFPEHCIRTVYWNIMDVPPGTEYDPLNKIEINVEELIDSLS